MNYHEDTVYSAVGTPSFFTPVKLLQDPNIVSRGLRLGILLGAAEPFLKWPLMTAVKKTTWKKQQIMHTTNIKIIKPCRRILCGLSHQPPARSGPPHGHPGAVRMAMPGTEMLQLTERFSVPNLMDLCTVQPTGQVHVNHCKSFLAQDNEFWILHVIIAYIYAIMEKHWRCC